MPALSACWFLPAVKNTGIESNHMCFAFHRLTNSWGRSQPHGAFDGEPGAGGEAEPASASQASGHEAPQGQGQQVNDVIAQIPRYAMPNIASAIPFDIKAEQEILYRTFNTGNFDLLRHLPEHLRFAQVRRSVCGAVAWRRWGAGGGGGNVVFSA